MCNQPLMFEIESAEVEYINDELDFLSSITLHE